MMSNQFGVFTLFALVGCVLVMLPQSAISFTVKLFGYDNSFGEVYVPPVNTSRKKIPQEGDVFPDPNGDSINDFPDPDEVSLDLLSIQGAMTNKEIDSYLEKYGYLARSAKGVITEKSRKEAIKEFQLFANLNPTGVIDAKTMSRMQSSRCGLTDPVSNSKFANFDAKGSRKWPNKQLTYRIFEYTQKLSHSIIKEYVAKAFKLWSDASQLVFTEIESGESDLKLRFSPRVHGDGEPFDGKNGVLAHAFYPESGEIHMDDEEDWSIKSSVGINLLFVLVHEIGHALGLGHSKVDNAIMGPFYNGYEPNLKLNPDDIAGIQFLYGKPITSTLAPNPTTVAPTTAAPTTVAPTTVAPTTVAPTTVAPTTAAPTTVAPTTAAPTTAAPTTVAPTTEAPTTKAPTTQAPTTQPSTTNAPTSQASTNSPTATSGLTTIVSTSTAVPTPGFSTARSSTTQVWTTTTSTTNDSTTEDPNIPLPTPPSRKFPCPFRFWAVMTAGNRTYGFHGRFFYEIYPNGKIRRGRRIRYVFQGGPKFVGAAAYNEETKHTFLFMGRFVYRYTHHTLDPGFPKKINYFVRAAVMMGNQLVAFSFNHIHYLDEDTLEDYIDGELTIDDDYPGLPKGINAAISYGGDYAYILYTRKVVVLDMYTGLMTETSCRRN